ncbi:hypothetical protein E2R60_04095 [Paenibacillus dendritiformis]|uniref:hypothetical protein n=1 Tax=Paenibacillus dendritiformis TaxID=130049 RepID=UPI00105A2166|nr:hypothetical protein [Paenibacillus dendritiformis]TDL57682.1 hypothetical protein E2R60_04095 [Paenibacillus dendritiformis]
MKKYYSALILIAILLTTSLSNVSAYESKYNYDENGKIKQISNDELDVIFKADKNGNITGRSIITKAGSNLVNNSGFKYVNSLGNALGWEYVADNKTMSDYRILKNGTRNYQQIKASNMPVGSSVGIKQTIAVTPYESVAMRSSLKIEQLQNANVVMALDYVDGKGNLIKRMEKSSTLTSDFFFTISEQAGSVPNNAKNAIIHLAIQSTGSNGSGSVSVKGVEVVYDSSSFFNRLSNHDFQGEGIQNGADTIADYWERVDEQASSTFSMIMDEGNKKQVVGRNGSGSKEVFVAQNIEVVPSRGYQLRGIFKKTGGTVSHLRILFFHQNGTLAGTNYTSSDNLSDNTLSVRGKIPRGAAYAKIVAGAEFNSAQGSGNVYIDDIEFEYSTEPQALSNSLFTLFSNKSDIANGWKKLDENRIGIFHSNGGKGQVITVPRGYWGSDTSVGIGQEVRIGEGFSDTKFFLRGEISCLKSENAKLEVQIRRYKGSNFPWPPKLPWPPNITNNINITNWGGDTESYELTPGRDERTVISLMVQGNKVTDAQVLVRLVPINPNEPWEASIVVHNLRFNPHYDPFGPVEMLLPEQTQ